MKRNRMSHLSLIANAKTDKPMGCSIVYDYIIHHPKCTYREISEGTGLPVNIVAGRINDLLYIHEVIKPDGVRNDMSLYRLRYADEAPARRPKSQAEQLMDKINAIQAYLGLTDQQLQAIIEKGKTNLFAKS